MTDLERGYLIAFGSLAGLGIIGLVVGLRLKALIRRDEREAAAKAAGVQRG